MRHPAARRVLWIDDDILPSSPSSAVKELSTPTREALNAPSGVVVEHKVDDALQRLQREPFDLLVADEQIARKRASRFDGDFGGWLRNAVSGTDQENIPFIYVTSHSPYGADAFHFPTGFQGVVSRRSDLWREIAEVLDRLVAIPGLVGVDGKPLRYDSPAGRELVVKFNSAREQILGILARRPEMMRRLGDREFEELIADLFARDGFEVELTSRSSDGGADVRAVRRTGVGKLLCIVECKRYKETNRIGPNLVRELRGVVDRDMATCGVLVTTSSFTRGAHREQRASPFRLFLKDLNQIAGWLNGKPVF